MREVFGLSDQAGGSFYVHQRERLFSDATFSFVFLVNSVLGKAPKYPEERTF